MAGKINKRPLSKIEKLNERALSISDWDATHESRQVKDLKENIGQEWNWEDSGDQDHDDQESNALRMQATERAIDAAEKKKFPKTRSLIVNSSFTASNISNIQSEAATLSEKRYVREEAKSRGIIGNTQQREERASQLKDLISHGYSNQSIAASNTRDPEEMREALKGQGQLSDWEHELGVTIGGIKESKKAGMSSSQISDRSSKVQERWSDIRQDKELTERIKSGSGRTAEQLETSINNRQKGIQGLEKKIAAGEAKDLDTSKLEISLDKLTKVMEEEIKESEKKIKEDKKQKDDRYGMILGGASAVQSVFNSAMKVGVSDDTQQTNNRTAWANTGNSMWDRGQDAVKNLNMESLMSVMDQSGRVGKEVANTTQNAKNLGGAARGAGVAIGVAQIAGGAGNWALNTGQQLATAGVAAGNISELGSDEIRNLTTNSLALNEYNAQMAAGEASRHMVASQAQEYVNHKAGSYYATRGAGSTSDMENTIMDMGNIKNYNSVGVGLSEARAAAGTMSKAGYVKSGELNNIIMGSGRAELAGSMSKQEYTTAAARLTGAGGDSKDLEAIMKSAVTAGMDNSKNISQMVEATLSLSSNMASTGISGVDTAKSMVGERVEDLVSKGYDRNMAAGKAMANIEAFDKGQTDRTVSFGNIIEQNKLRQLKGGQDLSQKQMNNLVDMKEIDMAAIIKGGPEGKKLAHDMGLGDFFSNKGNAQEVNKIKTEKFLLHQVGGAEQSASMMAKLEAQAKGEKVHFTDQERAVTYNSQSRTQTIDELSLTMGGKGGKPVNNAPKTTSEFGETKKAQDEREGKNAAVGKIAVEKMGGLTAAIQAMNKLVDPENFGKNIAKAASDFAPAAASISKATGDLLIAVKAIQAMNTANVNAMGKNPTFRPSSEVASKPKKGAPITPQEARDMDNWSSH